ncbi:MULTISPECIES: DUF3083 family protein [unclassified Shewanella]|uniref:DUF3083 family protein n=1 Tax=unclassified Shewanella TaxID=196818 RepID=UPI001BC40102|nr:MULTISPECIES: DUF3083 family protein [unclassified Shewanella]GIU05118.1 hypothetical protein TUM4444_00950 [Shewanella sp. MBTL60-112-B1]GIU24381.1 hypothetical protein TUM4445_01420 [Shewanella sp. MBTL60-112-B2]
MSLSHQQKVYIPKDVRANQYITAEILVTDALLTHYPDYKTCYQTLSRAIFNLGEQEELYNLHVITNDKLPVVRFHSEAYCFPTQEQIIFFYNPEYHEAQSLHSKDDYRARKIRIAFLATGDEIRSNSANFHIRVQTFLSKLLPQLPEQNLTIKIRDHQHLSYDLFAKAKGNKESYGYKLRSISDRYRARQCPLPDAHGSLCYVTVKLPLSRRLKQAMLPQHTDDFTPMYQKLEDVFVEAASAKQLKRIAMVANGLTPLVRNSKFDQVDGTDEVQMLGFDPNIEEQQFIRHWDGSKLVEMVSFTIAAGVNDSKDGALGRYLNRVEDALRSMTSELALDKSRDELIVRFHQHISYQAPEQLLS